VEETAMKGPFRLQIMIAFIVTLSFLVGQTPSQVFAGEIVVQGDLQKKYDPQEGQDRLVPANYQKMYDPEKQCDVLIPGYYAPKYDPSEVTTGSFLADM
jgi:hypothetical protein